LGIRLCLHFGIQPVLIPVGEPWQNGVIEKFNDTYSGTFCGGSGFQVMLPGRGRANILNDLTISITDIVV